MLVSILVTGHRGYIGSALTEKLRALPWVHQVIGYDILDDHNILDYDLLVSVLLSHKITVVVHLAALSSVSSCTENPNRAAIINETGTKILLAAMRTVGCTNIIYASTSSVYGNSKCIPFTEETPVEPCSIYGSTKLLGERAIIDTEDTFNYFIFRLFNVVGTSGIYHLDTSMNSGYDRIFTALLSGHVFIYGSDYSTPDGTCSRDYVALKDVCDAFILGVKNITIGKRLIINIASNHLTSVLDIVHSWNSINSKNVIFTYGPRRAGDPEQVIGSNDVAYKVLSWKPSKKIEDIIIELAVDKNTSPISNV